MRARGVCTPETPASTALGRTGGLTGKRGETGQRCLCRRCCHRAINTVSAHTRRRLRRAPSAKSAAGGRAAGAQGQRRRAGDCRGSSCVAASASGGMASRHPRPPAPSLPPALRAGSSPRASHPAAKPVPAGPLLQSRRAPEGDDLGTRRGWGGSGSSLQPRVSVAVPFSWGNRQLLKPVECPQRAANFLMQPQVTEPSSALVYGWWGWGETEPARSVRSLTLTFRPV